MLHPPRNGRKADHRGSIGPARKAVFILVPLLLLAGAGLYLWREKPTIVQRIVHPRPDVSAELGKEHAIGTLENFDEGTETDLEDGRILREFWIEALDKPVAVSTGDRFQAWTFNDGVPGPTLRCAEGDSVIIHFRNQSENPHSLRIEGYAASGGAGRPVPPGQKFEYRLTPRSPGLYVYHSDVAPASREIARGLFGLFLVDGEKPRPDAREMVMVMTGFDLDTDGRRDEVCAVNGFADVFREAHPVPLETRELLRIYIANMSACDSLIAFRADSTAFRVYGPRSMEAADSAAAVTLVRGQPTVLEFRYANPGRFAFGAVDEGIARRGLRGVFDVKP